MPLTHPSSLVSRGEAQRFDPPGARGPGQASRLRGGVWHGAEGALACWHLLSLDAPTIATLWTAAIARGAGVQLPAAGLAAMFLAVWMVYAGDRLLDARARQGGGTAGELEPRHLFHRRYRRLFLTVLAGAGVGLCVLLRALPAAEMRWQASLAVLLAGYFLLIHAPLPAGMAGARRLPKELAVGVFFAAATSIPTLTRCPGMRLRLLPVAVLFAVLCSLNCAAIYRWEHEAGAGALPAHPLTCFAVRRLHALLAGVVLAALALAPTGAEAVCYGAIAMAAALLLVLDRLRGRMEPVTLRALGDLALATPALLWPLLR